MFLILRTSLFPAVVGGVMGGVAALLSGYQSSQTVITFIGDAYPLLLVGSPLTLIILLVIVSRRVGGLRLSSLLAGVWGAWVAFVMSAMYMVGVVVALQIYTELDFETTAFYNDVRDAVIGVWMIVVLLVTAGVGALYCQFGGSGMMRVE